MGRNEGQTGVYRLSQKFQVGLHLVRTPRLRITVLSQEPNQPPLQPSLHSLQRHSPSIFIRLKSWPLSNRDFIIRLLQIGESRLRDPLLEVVIYVHGLVGFDAACLDDFVKLGEVGGGRKGAVVGVDLGAEFDCFNPAAGLEVPGLVLGRKGRGEFEMAERVSYS